MTNKNLSRRALLATAGMAATWAGLLSTPAWADPSSTQLQAQLDQARADLESMGDQLATLQNALSATSEALEATRSQVTETQEKIDATSTELEQKRGVLSGRMRSAYKGGSESALDVILGSTSVEDLVSRVYYLDKVNDSDANAIDEVRSLTEQLQQQMSDLENQQSEQEAQAAEAQQNLSSYESEVERAQSYYNSLDSQVQETLAKEAAEEAARQAEQASHGGAAGGISNAVSTVENTNAAQNNGGVANTDNATNVGNAPSHEESTPSTGTGSGEAGSSAPSKGTAHPGIVSCAAKFLGYPYKSYYQGVNYGPNADGFDCCGLVATAYHLAGYSLPYATTVGGLMSYIKGRGNWKSCSLSNYQDVLAVGDVIFCSPGHVAIYAGGSTMIHAPVPGKYVCCANVYACIGGGFGRLTDVGRHFVSEGHRFRQPGRAQALFSQVPGKPGRRGGPRRAHRRGSGDALPPLALSRREAARGRLPAPRPGTWPSWPPGRLRFLASSLWWRALMRWEPATSGSGIPQVDAEVMGRMDMPWHRVVRAKFCEGTLITFAGLSMGREGPSVQLGGMSGKAVSRILHRKRGEERLARDLWSRSRHVRGLSRAPHGGSLCHRGNPQGIHSTAHHTRS